MASRPYLLDTSALFTLIEDEDGADRVEAILNEKIILIPWLVLLEVTYVSRQEWGEETAARRYAMLRQLTARILWETDEQILLTAARIKAEHRLSLADAIIAAFAIIHDAILLHKDPEYGQLQGQVLLEALPYK